MDSKIIRLIKIDYDDWEYENTEEEVGIFVGNGKESVYLIIAEWLRRQSPIKPYLGGLFRNEVYPKWRLEEKKPIVLDIIDRNGQ